MIEQKLFFTRNGEYTIWEKIDSLKDEELNTIIRFIKNTIGVEISNIEESSHKKREIYTIYNSNENKSNILETEINKYFSAENINKCDFNATLYKINLEYTNIDLAYNALQKLKSISSEFDIQNISIKVFLKKDIECIDIRLSSYKINDYKDNSNEQIINTEVRIYFSLGLLIITDYSEYTHNRGIKDILLNNIYSLLNDNYENRTSYKLSDITLRLLLKKSNKYASKFKFYIDEYLNVDFNITEDMGANPLEHSGLREFYDKHPISVIKIAMNSNDDKYITVDGERGKLMSRSKTMEVKDIDEFIKLLNDVIKYNYLNFDYKKNLRDAAMCKIIGHTSTKLSYINDLYIQVESKILTCLGDKNDVDTVALTKNTFFYCLVNNKLVINTNDRKYKLDNGVIKQLSKWLEIEKQNIEATFDYLIGVAINNNDTLLEAFDNFINFKGDLNVNQV